MSLLLAPLRWLARWAVAAVLVLMRRRAPEPGEREDRQLPADAGAERTVALLLATSALASLAAVVVYLTGANTQLLAITLGGAMLSIAAALVIAASRVVPQEESTEERPQFAFPDADRGADDGELRGSAELLVEARDGVTRRRLLLTAGGAAGAALGAAVIVPLASLGPNVKDGLVTVPFRDGTRLVDEEDKPIRVADIGIGSFVTGFAAGAGQENEGAVVVIVRVSAAQLDLPPERRDWAPQGFLAFSKICTHAGCAINLFRSPLYAPQAPGPALVCPCHYSTFDVLTGGTRTFGPASRPLPQLPLRIEGGALVAAGGFSGRVGPSWSGVRE